MIRFTRVKPPGGAGKRYFLDDDGSLRSTGVPVLGSGKFATVRATDIRNLIERIDELLEPGHVVLWATAPKKKGRIAPQGHKDEDALVRSPTVFARREDIGVVALDYDPAPGMPAITRRQYVRLLRRAGLTGDLALRESTSSLIYSTDGRMLKGPGGLRALGAVRPATMIPRLIDDLMVRGWLAGSGHIRVSDNGRALGNGGAKLCQ